MYIFCLWLHYEYIQAHVYMRCVLSFELCDGCQIIFSCIYSMVRNCTEFIYEIHDFFLYIINLFFAPSSVKLYLCVGSEVALLSR